MIQISTLHGTKIIDKPSWRETKAERKGRYAIGNDSRLIDLCTHCKRPSCGENTRCTEYNDLKIRVQVENEM